MLSMMYLIGLIIALAIGLLIKKKDVDIDKKYGFQKKFLLLGNYAIPVKRLLFTIIGVEFTIWLIDITYATYIGSILWFLFWLMLALVFGGIADAFTGILSREVRKEQFDKNQKTQKLVVTILFFTMVAVVLFFVTFASAGYFCFVIGVIFAIVLIIIMFIVTAKRPAQSRVRPISFGTSNIKTVFPKAGLSILIFLILLLSMLTPVTAPSGIENEIFDGLDANSTSEEAKHYITNNSEIRVISWRLATAYLQRAYGESASMFDTDQDMLMKYTDPTYLNGRLVWVNVPAFEFVKWFGHRKVPFLIYVENVPENMSLENPNIVHRVEKELSVHFERIEWEWRIEQLCFDRYSWKYEIVQVRIDLDNAFHPYFIVYLGQRGVVYNLIDLKKILIIDATDINKNWEYNVGDENIPDWLEVVYPNIYVYNWVKFWGENRFGVGYHWFNKRHIYVPDDIDARFLVVDGKTYWQIPMEQKDSRVLGGYAIVDTRDGKAIFYNREEKSFCDMDTAKEQVHKYLFSGVIGYQRLDLDEGYLYPVKLNSGEVRESYVFPLYAGYTVQKYAILDAQDYTAPPFVAENLDIVIEKYKSRSYEPIKNISAKWENFTLQNGYFDETEAVLTMNSTTWIIEKKDLAGGFLPFEDNEWRELRLAVTEFQRIGNVTISVVIIDNKIVDVDWDQATLVKH